MKDVFHYEIPLGFLGSVFNKLILHKYMTNLLLKRNKWFKEEAERKVSYLRGV